VEQGFEILIRRVEDLFMDVPRVLQYLSCFLARAIVDDCSSPAFLLRVNDFKGEMGAQVVAQTELLLKQEQSSVRIAKVWGSAAISFHNMKRSVEVMVKEYFDSGDVINALACLEELKSPHYNHEFIKRLFVLSLDQHDEKQASERTIALITAAETQARISRSQLEMGFSRVLQELNDIALDSPNAKTAYASVVKAVGLDEAKIAGGACSFAGANGVAVAANGVVANGTK
jgi:hypothetical protein